MTSKLCAILGLALLLVSAVGPAARGRAPRTVASLRFAIKGPSGSEQAIAAWPIPTEPGEKLPVVVALHGKGESVLGPQRGYAAWVERYGLRRAYESLLSGVLSPASYGGLVRDAELTARNDDLRRRAYQGVLVIGVYTPDIRAVQGEAGVERFATWLARELLPQVHKAFPFASTAPRQVGIDGVSLGGALALEVGLRFPDVFGSVGALQPAISGREPAFAELADRARRTRPQALRLMSSDGDPYLVSTRRLSAELRTRRISHDLVVTPGGHDYAFNRGPGAIELLRFHDLALRQVRP
jgi:enterochelin esterase-like enzyme